jgi:hypothetical protein
MRPALYLVSKYMHAFLNTTIRQLRVWDDEKEFALVVIAYILFTKTISKDKTRANSTFLSPQFGNL